VTRLEIFPVCNFLLLDKWAQKVSERVTARLGALLKTVYTAKILFGAMNGNTASLGHTFAENSSTYYSRPQRCRIVCLNILWSALHYNGLYVQWTIRNESNMRTCNKSKS
jgi:hypothetical protein